MNHVNHSLELDDVWRQYQHSLKAFLHSKVANDADVEDLQQEILLKTYQNLSQVHNEASVKAWLFQLAQRTIIDFYRKRARTQRDHDLRMEDLWFEPSSESLEQDMANCIAPFIQALPEGSAELLSAVELNGMSQKALAAQQGVSYSTLKSRVQKSRGELKKLFEECCDLELDKHGHVIDYQKKTKSVAIANWHLVGMLYVCSF
ncbi:RNA polymerase sigma factor SigZ [Vibrio ichthyoenteri ATCC 700023]|uniref:RNA polymerase sigma factor SigZ n=1 Tax=Vibrio ichthyoenteri ATCC 700023 TaxID=870968 RepID=F9RXJ2_9VIBR|nr:RNA polymerase sigma factor SigZ [Vibrio ichthyoenteri]EGU47916.1 RNA polymerase sigma factor SigZ [Vibrio ichthyoenteri ATCC 700023]